MPQVHSVPGRRAAWVLVGRWTGSLSTRIAVALNSAVPDFGSVASMREHVGVHLVGEVQGHEGEARAAAPRSKRTGASTDPRRDDTRTRSPSATPSRLGVLGREVERLAAAQRRGVAAGLHAGVVGVEPAAGGEPEREVGVEPVDRRVVLDDA